MLVNYSSYSVHRALPRNIVHEDVHLFKHELDRSFDGFSGYLFERVWLDSGGIISKPFHLVYPESLCNIKVEKSDYIKRIKQSAKIILKRHIGQHKEGIWISERWSHGYFHWFCDALTRLIAWNDFQDRSNHLILPEHYSNYKYIVESISFFGFTASFLPRGSTLFVNQLFMMEPTARPGNYHPPTIKKLNAFIRSKISDCAIKSRIYISRSKAKVRRVLNESQCIPILHAFGFEVVHLEDLDFELQMKKLASAEVIMGIHGAGLTNMLAAKSGTTIIEIRGEQDDKNNCFFSLAGALENPYYYIKVTENPTETDRVGNVSIDPDYLKNCLDQILNNVQ